VTQRRALYQQVDALAQGTILDTTPILTAIRRPTSRWTDKALSAADAGFDQKTVDLLQRGRVTIGARGQQITGTSDTATFTALQEAGDRLAAVARRFDDPSQTNFAVGTEAGRLSRLIDQTMEAGGRRLNPDALTAWKAADAVTKAGYERLEGSLVSLLQGSVSCSLADGGAL
jgi:hypothetical protein